MNLVKDDSKQTNSNKNDFENAMKNVKSSLEISKKDLDDKLENKITIESRKMTVKPKKGLKQKINARSTQLQGISRLNPRMEYLLTKGQSNQSSKGDKAKFSVLDKFHFVLYNRGEYPGFDKNNSNEMSINRYVQYNEYKDYFKEKNIESKELNDIKLNHNEALLKFADFQLETDDYSLDAKKNYKRILRLQEERIDQSERNFLNVVERNNFEKLDSWKPTHWYSKLFWYILYVATCIQSKARRIIRSPSFEGITIFVIIVNSVFLAMEDPTTDETKEWEDVVEWIFLGLYTLEMVLKILGDGFIISENSY